MILINCQALSVSSTEYLTPLDLQVTTASASPLISRFSVWNLLVFVLSALSIVNYPTSNQPVPSHFLLASPILPT